MQAVRAVYLITRDRALAEDIVRAAFIRAYERIDQFDIDRSFGPWFLKSVTNDAIKAAQRRKRHVPLDAPTDTDTSSLLQHLVDERADPVDDVETAETREEIWEALGKLPPVQRAAIVMRYYLDMSEQEMVTEMERPRGTVKWRLHKARERLRRLLRPLLPARRSQYREE